MEKVKNKGIRISGDRPLWEPNAQSAVLFQKYGLQIALDANTEKNKFDVYAEVLPLKFWTSENYNQIRTFGDKTSKLILLYNRAALDNKIKKLDVMDVTGRRIYDFASPIPNTVNEGVVVYFRYGIQVVLNIDEKCKELGYSLEITPKNRRDNFEMLELTSPLIIKSPASNGSKPETPDLADAWEEYALAVNTKQGLERTIQDKPSPLVAGDSETKKQETYLLNVAGKRIMELTHELQKKWSVYPSLFIVVYQEYGLQIVLEPDTQLRNFRTYFEISPKEAWADDKEIKKEIAYCPRKAQIPKAHSNIGKTSYENQEFVQPTYEDVLFVAEKDAIKSLQKASLEAKK